jgi:hypothetical protein
VFEVVEINVHQLCELVDIHLTVRTEHRDGILNFLPRAVLRPPVEGRQKLPVPGFRPMTAGLSPSLFTNVFHVACSSAAPSTSRNTASSMHPLIENMRRSNIE